MASTVGHQSYDESLLKSVPVTKAQLQSGYNPDLLIEKHTPPPSRQGVVAPTPATDGRELESQSIPPKQPFYRTKKGIIIIVVVVVVIIAVVVGGAVGGSKKKNHVLTGQTSGSGSQGGGILPGSNSTTASSASSSGTSSAGASQVIGAPDPTPTSVSGIASTTISNPLSRFLTPPVTPPVTSPTPAAQNNQEVGLFDNLS